MTTMQKIATALVVALLLASVYLGFSNADDIVNTITVWQRLVGITATAYAIAALVALYGLWRRRRWLARCLEVWAFLVVFTAALAAGVYGQRLWPTIVGTLVSALVVAPVVMYGRRRVKSLEVTSDHAAPSPARRR